MIILDKPYLLFIEPQEIGHTVIIDTLTRKMTALYKAGLDKDHFFGWHQEICGYNSSCSNRSIKDEYITNSLCIHYMACHRPDIPYEQLKIIYELTDKEITPHWNDLFPQRFK